MLKLDAANLYAEITASKEWRDERISALESMLERYGGPFFKDGGAARLDPENFDYEFVALMLPQCMYNNPKANIQSKRSDVEAVMVGESLRAGLNRLQVEQRKRQKLVPWIVDCFFGVGATITTPRSNDAVDPGQAREILAGVAAPDAQVRGEVTPRWPVTKRIPMNRIGWDPRSEELGDARYIWHSYTRDVEDLKREAEEQKRSDKKVGLWNAEIIKSLDTELSTKNTLGPDRNETTLYEVWVPEAKPEDFGHKLTEDEKKKYHGMIFTVCAYGGKEPKEWVREPRPFYGPACGPYIITGYLPMPGDTFPLAPLPAIEGQIRDLNRQARVLTRRMESRKKFAVVDGSDPAFAQIVTSGKDGHVYAHASLGSLPSGAVETIDVGGIDAVDIEQRNQTRQTLERVSGFYSAQVGNVTGLGTATEQSIAATASQGRNEWLKRQIKDGVAQQMYLEAWYMLAEEEILFPLGPEVAQQLGLPPGSEPWFVGGDMSRGHTLDQYEIEIEPYSLERVDDQQVQARALQASQLRVSYSQMIPQMPWHPWEEEFRFLGDALNVPNFGDGIDIEAAREVGAQMMQMGALPQTQGAPKPVLGRQVESRGGSNVVLKAPQPMQGLASGQAASKERTR